MSKYTKEWQLAAKRHDDDFTATDVVVGDIFGVIAKGNAKVDEEHTKLFKLVHNDGSACPKFENLTSGESMYISWWRLKPHTPTTYEIGDNVYNPTFGWGKVLDITSDNTKCRFSNGTWYFTFDGRFYEGGPRSLMFSELTISNDIFLRPYKPALKVNDPIIVTNDYGFDVPAHFAEWGANNSVFVWKNGQTSYTTNAIEHYAKWKEYND